MINKKLKNKINRNQKERALDALKMFKQLVKNGAKTLKNSDFIPGNLIAFTYNAKHKHLIYDKTPLSMILWRTKGYTLGINFHWVPIKLRYILLNYIFKKNKKNIEKGLPLKITYKELKPMIIQLRLRAVVRLYINNRISKKGIIIPREYMRKAIDLPSEHFTGINAEQAYSLMLYQKKKNKPILKKKKPIKNRRKK